MLQRAANQLGAEVQRRAMAAGHHSGTTADRGHGPDRHVDRAGRAAADHPAQPVGALKWPLHWTASWSLRFRRARCSTLRKKTRSSSRATTAPTCSCNWNGLSSRPSRAWRSHWCASCWPQRCRDAARGGGHPLAQRPGLGHAGVPLSPALRPAHPARQLHPRTAALALPQAAECQPVPVGPPERRARGAERRRAGRAGVPALGARVGRAPARGAHRLRR
jgi:hypothetical protein